MQGGGSGNSATKGFDLPIEMRFLSPLFELRLWVLVFALLHPVFSSGLLFGWPGLLLILKEEGTYSFKCPSENASDVPINCVALDEYLNFVVVVATAIQFAFALPGGLVIDLFGPKLFLVIAQVFVTAGCLLIAVAKPVSNEVDLLFVGLTLMNIWGLTIAPSYFHYANLYPSSFNVINALFSSSVGVSSVMFPVMELLSRYFGFLRSEMLSIYTGIVGFFILFSLIQPSSKMQMGDQIGFSWKSLSIYVIPAKATSTGHTEAASNTDTAVETVNDDALFDTSTPPHQEEQFAPLPRVEVTVPSRSIYLEIKGIVSGVLRGFRNGPFRVLITHLSCWSFICLFYLTSVDSQLAEIAGEDPASRKLYTFIFSWIAPLGTVGSICSALLLGKFGYRAALLFQIFLGLTHVVISLIHVLPIQLITFFTYTTAQEAAFAIIFTFLNRFFPNSLLCTFSGVILSLQGVFTFLINPIVSTLLNNGYSFRISSSCFLVVGLLTLLTPFVARWDDESLRSSANVFMGSNRGIVTV